MLADPSTAPLTPVDRALCDFAIQLTRHPGAMARSDVDALRARGLSDEAVHEATQVIALFNYYNRIADGLGIAGEPDW